MSKQSHDAPTVIREFDPFRVKPLPGQPRKRFAGIPELAASIKEVGQTAPGLVVLLEGDPEFDARLIDGERRLRACKNVGCKFRAEVRPPSSDDETFVMSFAANFGRQDHDCMEIAEGLGRLQKAGKSVKQLSAIAGKSECWVRQYLSFNTLHPDVKAMMLPSTAGEKPTLNFQLALLIVPLPEGRQPVLARKICKDISFAAAERLILNERRDAGEAESKMHGQGNSGRSIYSLVSILEDVGNRLGIYVDVPGAELSRMIDARDAKEKRDLIKAFEDVIENLQGLSDAVKSRLPKITTRQSA